MFDPNYQVNFISTIESLNDRLQVLKQWSDWRQFFYLKISKNIEFTWVQRKLSLEERELEKSLSANCLDSFLNKNHDIDYTLRQSFHKKMIKWQTWRDIFTSGDKSYLSRSMGKTRVRLEEIKEEMASVPIKNRDYGLQMTKWLNLY